MTPPDPSPLEGKKKLKISNKEILRSKAEWGIPPSGMIRSTMGAIIDMHKQAKHFKSVMGCWPVNHKDSPGIQWQSSQHARTDRIMN